MQDPAVPMSCHEAPSQRTVYVHKIHTMVSMFTIILLSKHLGWMQEVWRTYAIRELLRSCEERNARRSMLLGFLSWMFFDDFSGGFQPCRAGKRVKQVKHVMCPFLLNLS